MSICDDGNYSAGDKEVHTLLGWVCTSFGIGVLVATSLRAKAGFRGDPELFRVLAMAQRNNAERISSWQGSSRVEVTRADPSGLLLRDVSAYHFIYAREHDATRWNWTPGDRYARVEGRLVRDLLPDKQQSEMRKGDAFYKYNLGVELEDVEKRGTLVIWPERKAEEGVYSYSFDPMWYLTGEVTSWDDMATGLMEYYRQVGDPNLSRFAQYALTRAGPLVTLDIENPTADMTNCYVFDLSKGGTLARYHATMKGNAQSIEWTYEQKDGVWIPKTCTKTIEWNPPRADGSTKYTRTVTFVESVLNRPVPASEFSLDKLGLKVGDLVSDHKLGLRYQYGGVLEGAAPQGGDLPDDEASAEFRADVPNVALVKDDAPSPGHFPADGASSRDRSSEQEEAQPVATNAARGLVLWLVVPLVVGGAAFVLLRRRWKARAES